MQNDRKQCRGITTKPMVCANSMFVGKKSGGNWMMVYWSCVFWILARSNPMCVDEKNCMGLIFYSLTFPKLFALPHLHWLWGWHPLPGHRENDLARGDSNAPSRGSWGDQTSQSSTWNRMGKPFVGPGDDDDDSDLSDLPEFMVDSFAKGVPYLNTFAEFLKGYLIETMDLFFRVNWVKMSPLEASAKDVVEGAQENQETSQKMWCLAYVQIIFFVWKSKSQK